MKLGTLLLRNAAIGLAQLETALRNQVLYGGKLGTNLVELGFIDLDLLSYYLAELYGFPAATPAMLEAVPRETLEMVGSDMAHALGVIPLGASTESTILQVAMIDPNDVEALEQLADKTKRRIDPHILPELRLLYYLERLFGVPRKARFVRAGARKYSSHPSTEGERRRLQPPGGMALPPDAVVEPRRRRASSMPPVIPPTPRTLSMVAAIELLATARNREDVADTLIEFANGRLETAVLFIVRDSNAIGWRAQMSSGRGLAQSIESLSLPLGGASALQAAHDSMQAFYGRPPSPAHPVESQLWKALGTDPPPVDVIVIPILSKHRCIGLLYAHSSDLLPFPDGAVEEVMALCDRAGEAFATLMLRQSP